MFHDVPSECVRDPSKIRCTLWGRNGWSDSKTNTCLQPRRLDDRLSGNGGITAAAMNPTIAPYQIDIIKSNRTRLFAEAGSPTGFTPKRRASAARGLWSSPAGGWSDITSIFIVGLLDQDTVDAIGIGAMVQTEVAVLARPQQLTAQSCVGEV
jgi:hypothetical protein